MADVPGTCSNAVLCRVFRPPKLSRSCQAPTTGGSGATAEIRLVSYNVLADTYAKAGKHDYCSPEARHWSRRSRLILDELRAYAPDIVMMQELEPQEFVGAIGQGLRSLGLVGEHVERSKTRRGSDGVALFWRTSRFILVDRMRVTLSEFSKKAIMRIDKKLLQSKQAKSLMGTLNQCREVAVLTLLEDKMTKTRIISAAVHLFWDPRWPDVKVLQTAGLMEALKTFADKVGLQDLSQIPVIIGGDFNSLPIKPQSDVFDTKPVSDVGKPSGVYSFLADGRLEASHPHHPAMTGRIPDMPALELPGGLELQSVYSAGDGSEPIITTRVPGFDGTLDYIWVSRHHWSITALLDLPFDSASAPAFPSIPNEDFPSDHLAVGSSVELIM